MSPPIHGPEARPLAPGLYLVATPIGAARDITLRALDILAAADVLAAEDTRTLRHLMEIHGIALNGRPLVPCHDHNEAAASPRLLRAIAEGKSVAYASEAGTPLVSDPGFQLARAAIGEGPARPCSTGGLGGALRACGCGAAIGPLSVCRVSPGTAQRPTAVLSRDEGHSATLIFYESPKRIHGMLDDLADSMGGLRRAAVCRELTKRFEEVTRGTVAELAAIFAERDVKGEIVVLVDRAAVGATDAATWEDALDRAMQSMSVKDAAAMVAEAYDLPRRDVYQVALSRGKADRSD